MGVGTWEAELVSNVWIKMRPGVERFLFFFFFLCSFPPSSTRAVLFLLLMPTNLFVRCNSFSLRLRFYSCLWHFKGKKSRANPSVLDARFSQIFVDSHLMYILWSFTTRGEKTSAVCLKVKPVGETVSSQTHLTFMWTCVLLPVIFLFIMLIYLPSNDVQLFFCV